MRRALAVVATAAMALALGGAAQASWGHDSTGTVNIVAGQWQKPFPPPVATLLVVSGSCDGNSGQGKATLSWKAVEGATGYQVDYTQVTTGNPAPTQADMSPVDGSPFSATTLSVDMGNKAIPKGETLYADVQALPGGIWSDVLSVNCRDGTLPTRQGP